MEPIKHVDLSIAAKEAEAEAKEDEYQQVVSEIRHLLGQAYNAQRAVERVGRQLEQEKARCAKVMAQLDAVRGGDWSKLPEKKEDKKAE